jgi:hypothetical protein
LVVSSEDPEKDEKGGEENGDGGDSKDAVMDGKVKEEKKVRSLFSMFRRGKRGQGKDPEKDEAGGGGDGAEGESKDSVKDDGGVEGNGEALAVSETTIGPWNQRACLWYGCWEGLVRRKASWFWSK